MPPDARTTGFPDAIATRRGHHARHDNRNHRRRQPRRDGCTAPRERRRGRRSGREGRIPGLLPAGAHYVKAFGSLGAVQLADIANREPRAVLFYATDDDAAAAAVTRLIRTAGFEPMDVGGLADVGRMEGPGGDLQGRVLDLDGARTALATHVTT
jgi:hypothetical protein